MSEDLARRIEEYLLDARGWVGAGELCRVFHCRQRLFRATGRRRGLCSRFAISGNDGFRHIVHATDEEFLRAYRRMRGHGLGELVHARELLRERLRRTTERPPLVFERATGQALLIQP